MIKQPQICKVFITLITLAISAFSYAPQYADSQKKIPLRWSKKIINITVSESLINNPSNLRSDENILEVINRSLLQWQDAADIEFRFVISDKQSVNLTEKSGDGVSLITIAQTPENILLFGEKASDTSAITKVFYDRSGNISEADIVLNPVQLFSTDGTIGTFDLEATLTHEVGHLLGLDHSKIIGSTMHIHQGRNGTYNLPGFDSRTISSDDRAGLISLYGSREGVEKCCGKIAGQIKTEIKSEFVSFHIWAEEFETGKVTAGVSTNLYGEFVLDGIEEGKYRLFAQPLIENNLLSTVALGENFVNDNETTEFNKVVKLKPKNFEAQYIGLNGQLSTLSVPVNRGKTFVLYIGGKNFNAKDFEIVINSKFFNIKKDSFTEHDFEKDTTAISFEIIVTEDAEDGDYSIQLKDKKEKTAFLVGGISIGKVINVWNL